MGAMPREQWEPLVLSSPMAPITTNTVVTVDGLERLLHDCREKGYFTCDEEIELGVRSIAIPLYNKAGETVASMSISTRAERLTTSEMVKQLLPTMLGNQEWARTRLG
jgi:IclR family pca regulon transcriptional regulator